MSRVALLVLADCESVAQSLLIVAKVRTEKSEGSLKQLRWLHQGFLCVIVGQKFQKTKQNKTFKSIIGWKSDQSEEGRSGHPVRDVSPLLPEKVSSFLQSNPQSIKC